MDRCDYYVSAASQNKGEERTRTGNVRMTGGCLCGAVRYEVHDVGTSIAICHCTHCRRQSGSAFSANLMVLETHYQQKGETKVYQDVGDSGQPVYRNFCPACGSPILSRVAASPGKVYVKVGTLDDPAGPEPKIEVYVKDALPLGSPIPGVPRFPAPRRCGEI